MGRKKTFVGTQVARVIEDDQLPDSVKKGVTAALFTGGEIVDHVLEEMVGNIGTRAERLYDFAKNGHYVHGLPSGQFKIPGDTLLTTTQTVLAGVHGSAVTMTYAHYGPPNNLHIGWMALLASHGYNPATNQLAALSTIKGAPVYLHDMKVVVPYSTLDTIEVRSLDQWGVSPKAGYTPERTSSTPATRALVEHSQVEVSLSATEEVLRMEYVWLNESDELQKEFLEIPVTGYDDELDYIHACYTVGGELKFWMYQVGEGSHPSLDQLFDAEAETGGEFFPFMYFRYGKVSEIADKTTESYKDNVKLAKYLGINYDQVAEGVDANPDIGDVEQAMMMFAVPANTENEQERSYLWQFFNNLYLSQGSHLRFQTEAQADIASSQLFGSNLQPPGIVIQDARFKMSLSSQGVYKIRKAGTIAEVGKHSSGTATFNVVTPLVETNYDTGVVTEYFTSTPITYHYYRRQVTHGLYEELQVVELQTRFHINGQYSTTGDEEDKILLIPLDHSITELYSIPEREILYARSLHFVFNSITTIKLKWYQTGLFKAILVIVAIVITVWSWGADGGSAISAALAVGNYVLATQLILTMIIEFVVSRLVLKLFVKAVGAEAAFIIAIVAAVAGVATGISSGGLAGAPWVSELLTLASGIAQAANAQIQTDLIDLGNEISEFSKYTEEQLKLIETAEELLGKDNRLSPFLIFGEKPPEFYNRTVHSGNIGVVAIEAISSFVDSKLTLPSLDDTLGRGAEMGEWKL